jgi:hypothetical protein
VHQGKEATALQRRGERTRRGDKQKVAQVLNGSRASAAVQRAVEEDEGGGDGRATREAYEQALRGRHAPEPGPPAPFEWKPKKEYPRQPEADREPER